MSSIRQVDGVTAPLYVRQLPEHAAIKATLLGKIAEMGTHSVEDDQQRISNTDWYLPTRVERKYMDIVGPLFEDHLRVMVQRDFAPLRPGAGYVIHNFWFQQYDIGDYHGWHSHGECMYSNVYYLELPNGAARTSFFINGEEVFAEVKEGDILSFPATLIHRSAPNTVGRKTAIVFNSSISW